ncbi:hypothetical protein [Leptospira bandrabouensis]|uniref:Dolichyl-phosphate-mannose--protein mannosyltransferase n=1 Tax=Leptospira bandrabouensis TaxID=2484903 RepID=A0A6H3NM46_9LEPT|nr:hypothetical protein [Leptospira bandrabouensis]MCG6153839.1 hypothetical protein [Leptospira bandrabouensis]TGN08786.1 hypothetical protein EHR07_02435 [Leptospira bandrabouensis]TGN11323.1 hypothetical protein EHR08_17560 [Leptospira bandrabouensis]
MKKLFILLLLLFLFLFHLRYLSRAFDWDSCVYALNIQKDRIESAFFNPHHLGFESSGLLYWKMLRSIYPTTDIMFFLRLRILSFSLFFLGLFIWIYYKLYKDIVLAVILALVIQVSQAFWFYSLHNDTPLIHSCLMALLFLFTVYFLRSGLKAKHLVILWVIQLFSIYFHQSNVIHFGMVPMAVFLSPNRSLGKKLRIIFIYLTCLGVATILSYLFVGFIILKRGLGPLDEKHFSFWMFLYAAINRWGTSLGEEKNYVLYFYRGIGDAFLVFQNVIPKFRVNFFDFQNPKHLPYNLNLLFWIFSLSLGILNFRTMWVRYKQELLIMVFWILPSIGFYTWWEGYFFEFWVGTTIALWILNSFTLQSLSIPLFPKFSNAILHTVYLVLFLFYFSTNFTFSTLPRSIGPKFGYTEGIQGPVEKLAEETIYR